MNYLITEDVQTHLKELKVLPMARKMTKYLATCRKNKGEWLDGLGCYLTDADISVAFSSHNGKALQQLCNSKLNYTAPTDEALEKLEGKDAAALEVYKSAHKVSEKFSMAVEFEFEFNQLNFLFDCRHSIMKMLQ